RAGPPRVAGGGGVGGRWRQPVPVGPQHVGQHEGVEAVVFVARRTVARPQLLELAWGDDDHGQAGGQQGVDDRAVGGLGGGRGGSMRTWRTLAGPSRRTSWRSPTVVCATVNRATCRPSGSTTLTAWSSRAQSIPPVGPAGAGRAPGSNNGGAGG